MRLGFLGPRGTFTDEALSTQADLVIMELIPLPSFADVLSAVEEGEVEYGFLPIENSIEGTVLATFDSLVFERNLLIQREVILPIHQNLLARPGTTIASIREVHSYPHASGQCRRFLSTELPDVEVHAANSTAHAARIVAEMHGTTAAAIAPRASADLYGLEVLAGDIEDFENNMTRFVLLGRESIPAPAKENKTSIACFQLADRPGSLMEILSLLAKRDVNLTKLESRPTKNVMGEYCFIIDFDGHIADLNVAATLEELGEGLAVVKFLGSYPAASLDGFTKVEVDLPKIVNSPEWVSELRERVGRII